MNQGLKFYGVFFITLFTLTISIYNPNLTFATLSTSSMGIVNSTQSNLGSNIESDDVQNDDNGNDDKNRDNDDNGNDDKNRDNDDNGNDDKNRDDVPMSLPFNSNVGDQSIEEKDYSSIIPFP